MSHHGHEHRRKNSPSSNVAMATGNDDVKEQDNDSGKGTGLTGTTEYNTDIEEEVDVKSESPQLTEGEENHNQLSPRSNSITDDRCDSPTESKAKSDDGYSEFDEDTFEEEINLEPCEPENFNSKLFLETTQCFIEKFEKDNYKDFSSIELYPLSELKSLSTRVNVHMKDFYNYTLFTQNNINKLRSKIRIVSGKVREFLPRRHETSTEELTVEERELLAHIERLKGELAHANVDLAQAVKLSTESESAAIEAALSAKRAKDLARKLREDMEEQKRLEEEAKVREEVRRLAKEEEKKRKAEEREQHELKQQKEAENRSQSRSLSKTPVSSNVIFAREKWEEWEVKTYKTDFNDYNQAILCNIRGDPKTFNEESIVCEAVDQSDTDFEYSAHDELISCFIRIRNVSDTIGTDAHTEEDDKRINDSSNENGKNENGETARTQDEDAVNETDFLENEKGENVGGNESHNDEHKATEKTENVNKMEKEKMKDENNNNDTLLESSIFIAIPHCLSRLSAISREPVIKAKVKGVWTEMLTHDVAFENTKDLKFSQVELKHCSTLAVVSRFKKDYLKLTKRGNKIISSTDSRITITAENDTFSNTEHVILQVQPVESHSVSDLRLKNPNCKGLLASSAILNIEWESDDTEPFKIPLKVTFPCPPNPAKARKAAAIRAMKEARMKNPPRIPEQEEQNKKTERQESVNSNHPNRWYMGSYGSGDDDENDNLYMLSWTPKSKWQIVTDVTIQQIRLDLLQLELTEPHTRFVVIRTSTMVIESAAKVIVSEMESYLDKRTVKFMLKQRNDDLSEVLVHCVPRNRIDRLMESLREDGYGVGPAPSTDISLSEGDVINIGFRGNVRMEDGPSSFVFNSHMKSSLKFTVCEIDKYLQKSFPMYRGFAQLFRSCLTKDVKPGANQEFLCDLLVGIPKYHLLTPTPPVKAPITIKSKDVVNEELMRRFADEIGDEWQKLASILSVKKVRLQAILRNNEHLEKKEKEAESRYDMLMTWVKKVPRGVDKVSILRKALRKCERMDLVEELDDRNRDFLAHKVH